MNIQLTYEIPRSNLSIFKHLKTNRLVVHVDIAICETIDDLKSEIVSEILQNYGICIERFDTNAVKGWDNILRKTYAAICARHSGRCGADILKLNYGGIVLYPVMGTRKKWYLPVCAVSKKGRLVRSSPSNLSLWEEVELDGCPTLCFMLTWDMIKCLNKAPDFVSFFSLLSTCLGEGPMKEFFMELWLKHHNTLAIERNQWEAAHGIRTPVKNPYRGMSVRRAAKLSL